MTRLELIFDLIEILTKGGYSNDSRLKEDYLGYLVDKHRAIEIKKSYREEGFIETEWIQDLGLINTSRVNTADDVSVTDCGCEFSKIVLPPVVSITDYQSMSGGMGVNRIASPCNKKKYHSITFDKFMSMPEDSIERKFEYFIKVGNSYYFPNKPKTVRPFLILENPLDGIVNDNLAVPKGELVVGLEYTVYANQIVHNTIVYVPGESFVAANDTYLGNGILLLSTTKRQMTNEDQYPMSSNLSQKVVMGILSEEFNMESKVIADINHDSRDKVQVLGNEKGS